MLLPTTLVGSYAQPPELLRPDARSISHSPSVTMSSPASSCALMARIAASSCASESQGLGMRKSAARAIPTGSPPRSKESTSTTRAPRSIGRAGFQIRAQIIWAKQQFAIGRGDYHFKHEPSWYAVRKGKTGGLSLPLAFAMYTRLIGSGR
jgi:hypothetical protein